MIGHPRNSRLNDYVDGLLSTEEGAGLEEHLERCGRCRGEVVRMRELVERAAALPRSIEPSRELWHGISARIEAEQVVELAAARAALESERRSSGRAPASWSRPVGLAAAAGLLVLLSSGVTILVLRGAGDQAPVAATAPANGVRTVSHVEQGYAESVDMLRASLDRGRGELRPETVEVIEENLRIVDEAIARATEALEADPANVGLTRSLEFAYRQKLELLQRAVRLQRT